MTLPGPFCVSSRTFNSPSGELTTQVVSAFALAMVASVNATAVRKVYFTLVLHFCFGMLISAVCSKQARPRTGDLPCSCIPALSRFAWRGGICCFAPNICSALPELRGHPPRMGVGMGAVHQCSLPDTADRAVRSVSPSSEDVDVGAAHWRDLAPLRRNLSARS